MDMMGRAEAAAPQRPPVEEFDVRMTHASAKPRIGYTYDFAPDEEDEENAEAKPATPHVRTRTTIIIPDSPPLRPVDRKGKGRARTEDLETDVIDISDDPDPSTYAESSTMSPGSSSSQTKSKSKSKKREREHEPPQVIVEVLSDDESDNASGSGSGMSSVQSSQSAQPERMQTVLVCASCRRPLRIGGDRLWALRCGHMIDSRCYRKIAERSAGKEEGLVVPALGER